MAKTNEFEEVVTVLSPHEYTAALREAAARFMLQQFESTPTMGSIEPRVIEAAMFVICGINWVQPQCVTVLGDIAEESTGEPAGKAENGNVE
jgi:hypothetical protein